MKSALAPIALSVVLASELVVLAVSAQAVPPRVLESVRVDEHLGDGLPLSLRFSDTQGKKLALRELVRGDLPVLLVLSYARCAMLCNVLLQGVSGSVAHSKLVPGRDVRLINVSIDEREYTPEAAHKQAALLERIHYPEQSWRWPYLLGEAHSVQTLASALGFRYTWDARTEQYAHPAVAFVLTPEGRISRYLYGATFEPRELEEAVAAAKRGEIARSFVSEVLRCFRFEPGARRYEKQLRLYFRIGALVIFCLVASLVLGLLGWERRRRP